MVPTERIYLDYAATTPLRPEVREAMEPFFGGLSGNPSSIHRWGREARAALEGARERAATALGVTPPEVVFTRGGTESINLALFGSAPRSGEGASLPGTFLRSAIEHSAVREPMEELERLGHRVEVIGVKGREEIIDLEALTRTLSSSYERPFLSSFQWANQETGILLPIREIAERCATAGVPLHVDAVQAAGKIPLDLSDLPISLLSLSGHKLGGPRGTGVLVVRRGVELRPHLFGGGQERSLRPGTEDVAGAVGFSRALEIATLELPTEPARLADLRSLLESGLRSMIPDLRVHGSAASRSPHILSLGFPGLPRDLLPGALDLEGVGVSAGSACRSGSVEVSPVMEALYGEEAHSFAPLRLSLGWSTTQAEVEEVIPRIARTVERIRAAGVGSGWDRI